MYHATYEPVRQQPRYRQDVRHHNPGCCDCRRRAGRMLRGLSTSRAPARASRSSTARIPREKSCGGGVTGRALALVAGAIDIATLPSCRIRPARFTDSRAGRSVTIPLERDALVVASRAEFDGRLLAARDRRAPSSWRRARSTSRATRRVLIHTGDGRVAARLLIGADGANSLVRRRLATPVCSRAIFRSPPGTSRTARPATRSSSK